jgi:Zn-dependent protease with chaperone function
MILYTLLFLHTIVYADPGVNVTPYLDVLNKCVACQNGVNIKRIDIRSGYNSIYRGFAYYNGRIIIYDGNHRTDYEKKKTLYHEIAHIDYYHSYKRYSGEDFAIKYSELMMEGVKQ